MVNEKDVWAALATIEDPEVHKSITELEMVRGVRVEGNHVEVEIALTIAGCPLKNKINQDVRDVLVKVPGVKTVDVKMSAMTDEERARFAAKVRGGQAAATEGQIQPPLLQPDVKTQFVAVASGKGGVGKSTVTANLAVALARNGYRVGLIDADIYGFSIPNLFGLGDRKPALVEDLIMPVQEEGVKIISMGFFVPDNSPVIWRGPMLGKMLRNFFAEVHWGELDIMLLDLPPGTGDVALDVHQMLPKSKEIIVTTPQANAAEVAARAGAMAIKTNHEVIGVVENMSYFVCDRCEERHYIFGMGGGERLAKELGTTLLGQVPIGVATASGMGIYKEDSSQGQVYKEIARKVAEAVGLPAALNKTV
ncbi:iron-sulfur cluster carrier protein [Collibacillus ludicampi]|jgi:ATP-binding protein involved in chromosome partitioning|uniref:Iron-sulfur cluster carrier protein n=1 Tax=Collibacillus ludicampi TaxID=2771369 RepID=A0AAV4LEJ8_9BACL|nr:Mrp/NBP35 family ATP-binding protein [Collibacillus ludicampi]GIM46151.1 iron-sulfur cluster carrier protein [Collibacillus ludicampi]